MAEDKPQGIPSMVSDIVPLTEQVGGHVLQALKDPAVVAVVTTFVPGVGRDRVVSMPMGQEQLAQVQAFLMQMQDTKKPDPPKCVGFHCQNDDEDAPAEE